MADHKYKDESYLGDPEDDREEPEVRDLGFIVDDRDDRRAQTVDGSWDRLDDLDTARRADPFRPGGLHHG